jgi:hypothetical protein
MGKALYAMLSSVAVARSGIKSATIPDTLEKWPIKFRITRPIYPGLGGRFNPGFSGRFTPQYARGAEIGERYFA